MVTLKQALEKKLTPKQLSRLPNAYDQVGTIAVFSELDPCLKGKETLIAKTLLALHPHLKTVAKKTASHRGKYRTKKVTILAGDRTKTTLYKESGVRLKVNVETCYFSPRLSTERLRIAQQVKKGERILVMFSGVAPYPLVIATHAQPKEIVGVEMNPKAHALAEENLRLNKAVNVRLLHGDVNAVVPRLKEKFDRIVMPLPRGAQAYLPLALSVAKKNAILHVYGFQAQEALQEEARAIKAACPHCTVLRVVKCGQYSPRKFRVCVDVKV